VNELLLDAVTDVEVTNVQEGYMNEWDTSREPDHTKNW